MLFGVILSSECIVKSLNGETRKKINIKMNPLCSLTWKWYIKDVKQACHFFVHSKLKHIGYHAFFSIQELSDALTTSIDSINVAQIKKTTSTTSSTSV